VFFFKKQQAVLEKIKAYLEEVDLCGSRFRECVAALLNQLDDPENEGRVDLVHQAESKADDIRRQIEFELYDRALIPESRGDVLGLLETLDTIPGMFQSLCEQIFLQRIVVPEAFRERFLKLFDVNLKSYQLVREAVLCMFYGTDIRQLSIQIDSVESESDRIERRLIRDIFASDCDKADKILLKEIVVNTGDISDNGESVKDRLVLAVVKRKI
jgi:predicted phosphate transport protein (TIGR00153 family)